MIMTENGKPEFLDVFCLNFYGLLVFLCVGQPAYEDEYEDQDYVRLYELETINVKRTKQTWLNKSKERLVKLHRETQGEWFYAKKSKDCLIVNSEERNCFSHPSLKVYPVIHALSNQVVLPINIKFNDKICQEVNRLGLKDMDEIITGIHYAVYIGGIGDGIDSYAFLDKHKENTNKDEEKENNVEIIYEA